MELLKKRNRIFFFIVLWLLIGVFLSAFYLLWVGILVLTVLMGLCATLFILSIFLLNLRKMSYLIFFIIVIITILLTLTFLIFNQIILFMSYAAVISYVLITAIFSLYGCYNGGKRIDEYIYKKFPSPLNQILRIIEFLGGIFLSLLIIYLIFLFTGGQLVLITWIFAFTIVGLAAFGIFLLLITGKFNAWLGTFSLYGGIYFCYLVVVFLFGISLYQGLGTNPILTWVFIVADILILLYVIERLMGERADLLSKRLKPIKAETILMWLIFSKAAYELAIILDPTWTSFKNQWVLFIFVALVGLVGIYGLIKYKKYRKSKRKK